MAWYSITYFERKANNYEPSSRWRDVSSNNLLTSKSIAKSQNSPVNNRLQRFWRAAWPVALRAGISALVLGVWLRFSSIDLGQVFQILGHLSGLTLLAALAAGIGAGIMAAAKWQVLLRAQGVRIGFFRVWQFNIIAAFYGLVLPGTESGNAVKALLLGRISRRATGVWAAMLADQLNLLLAFALIAFAGVSVIATDAQLAGRGAWIIGAGLTVAGVLLFHLCFLAPPLAAFIRRLLRPISRLLRWRGKSGAAIQTSTAGEATPPQAPALEDGWLARFWDALAGYQQHLPALGLATLLSGAYQGFLVLAAYQFALGLGIQVSYLNLLWVMTLISIAQALPITFAGIGVREVALTYLLGGLGVPGPTAIALSFAVLALNATLGLPGSVLQIFLPAPAQAEPGEPLASQGET